MVAINRNETMELGDVANKIMGLQREDYAAHSNRTQIVQDGERYGIMSGGAVSLMPMTPHAREQLNNRWTGFNTFSKTLDSLGHQDIYTDTANELLSRDDRKMVVRTMQPNGERVARAVVSDAFKPIDDDILVPDMLEVIGNSQNAATWRSLGGQITDTNTYIRFITREPQITLDRRNLHIGFQYQNSEVGRGYAQFSAFFFDSFCENGCIFRALTVADVKYMHRGSRIETDFGRIFEERIQQQELAAIRGTVRDATRLAVDGAYIPDVRLMLERALHNEIPADTKTADFIKEVGKRVGLSQAEQEQSLVHFDGTNNQYGVQAAITRLAQDAPDFSRRVELEECGGKVLGMSDKVWASVAALAA